MHGWQLALIRLIRLIEYIGKRSSPLFMENGSEERRARHYVRKLHK